jgi:pimeloyl-ACP methyl ester carboxylesterase
MEVEAHDVIRSGAEIVLASTGAWLTPADVTGPVVVLVHGFTSHGRYLERLGQYLSRYGYVAALLNYDSYLGIDAAAVVLHERLTPLAPSLVAKQGYALVAHSMGGLVARHFASNVRSSLLDVLRGIALLGTPNNGALGGAQYIGYMLDWSDYVTSVNPFARSALCRSSMQLLLGDPERLIQTMNSEDAARSWTIPVMSISGGLSALEWSSQQGNLAAKLHNAALQRLIKEVPNDGLVSESSADIRRVVRTGGHVNNYSEYRRINHTNLVTSQAVADIVVAWLQREVF